MECPKCHADNPSDSKFCKECGVLLSVPDGTHRSSTETLQAPRIELNTGVTFAQRYQIIEELGKGGMGKVYKAYDEEIKEKVALKLIKPEIAEDNTTVERFRNELKFARKIRHKNVCQMYDLNKEEGSYYITMEYVSGEDLKSFIRRSRRLNIGTAILIAKQVCEGLIEAHKLGVVHRDLKPQNVMIDKDGNARIMDFGIARLLDAKGITDSGLMIGTPEYMSPEQVEGKEADYRTDIYSLGIILYEMVTGQVPFEGETPISIAMQQINKAPFDPKEVNPQVPEDMSQVILKCVEKKRKNRYQNAKELLSELVKIEKSIPTTERELPKAKPATSKEMTQKSSFKLVFPFLIVLALVFVGFAFWKFVLQKDAAADLARLPSIAVLPFTDLSPQKDQEYLCDGLAEELINSMSNIQDLRVVARTSAFSFKGKEFDVRDIGKKLDVETVLEGSVRKSGEKLRITVQLIDVEDGYQLWAERYDRAMDDVFKIQDEITLAILNKLRVKLLGGERAKLGKRQTEDTEAYNLYLKGRYYWNKRNEKEIKIGIRYFQQAIEKDPSYSVAYTGLADCYNVLGFYCAIPPEEAFTKAEASALKALEIDDTLAEAHTSLAYSRLYYEWDWSSAEKEFKIALKLNPTYATTHHWYAEYLAARGWLDEAIKEKKRASQLDPLSMIINTTVGWIYYFDRNYDDAIEQIKETLKIDENFVPAHFWLGQAYEQKGMFQEAIVEFQKAVTLSRGSSYTQASLAHAHALAGERDKAVELLDRLLELSKDEYISSYDIAEVYVGLGEKDLAFDWLQKAFKEKSRALVFLKVEPRLDPLRSDERFSALLKRLNLEE